MCSSVHGSIPGGDCSVKCQPLQECSRGTHIQVAFLENRPESGHSPDVHCTAVIFNEIPLKLMTELNNYRTMYIFCKESADWKTLLAKFQSEIRPYNIEVEIK
jgi:hypothetical protein